MQNAFRILAVVLTTQSVGCAMLVGNPNPAIQDDHNSQQTVASQPNPKLPNYEGNVVAWQYSPIVARSTASNSSLGAKATEVVEAERAAKHEARRQRDQRFAEVQKEVNAQLQQRQSAPVVTEAFPPPSLPVDAASASSEPPRREVKKKLYLDDAQFQQAASTTVSPIAVAPQPWQSMSARPLAIVTMVVLVLSGVTWPLTRSQRIAQLFARFHRPAENAGAKSTLDHSDSTESTTAPSEPATSCDRESLSSGFDNNLISSSIEAETCFSSCDPIAEDKQAWLSEFESASTDFMVVCVDSWSQNDLIAPRADKSEEVLQASNATDKTAQVTEQIPLLEADANTGVEADAVTSEEAETQANTSKPESIAAETVLPATVQSMATSCRALIAVNHRIVIGSPRALLALSVEHTESRDCDMSSSSSFETSPTAITSVAIVANAKPRGVSLMGLPAKGPAKPVYPKLMPPAQVQNEVESQNQMCGESVSENAARRTFQEFDSIGSAQKFVGFVVLFSEDGTIGSFQKLMIVESFQLKDQSELTANVVRVA